MRYLCFLVAALAAFLCGAAAQPLPHPSTSPSLVLAQTWTYQGAAFPHPPGTAACPVAWQFMQDKPTMLPPVSNLNTPLATVEYACAVEDLSQPNAAAYPAIAMVWSGAGMFLPPWTPPAPNPWWNNWGNPPVFNNLSNYYALPGFWSPCDLTWMNPSATPVPVLPTHQDVGPVLGFPRYWIGWNQPSTHGFYGGAWYVCVQWITLHPNGTLRLSPPIATPTF